MEEIFEKIQREDLTDDMQLIADIFGMDTARKLLMELGGISIYVPKMAKLESFVKRYVKENKEKGVKSIARDLKLSEHFIKKFA